MKTLTQEAPIVNTSSTPASEDNRSQLHHAAINHLTGRENAIFQYPWLPNLTLLIELHRHITQVLDERLAPEKKRKKYYSKHTVLWKYSLE